ncbi:MAG: hypothetical protein KAR12_14900 [Methylococcales bacterium]|nr:hypothetical protein [Methylococcales bacterium]
MKFLFIVVVSLTVSGCASFGKGIAEAILEKDENESPLLCEIIGKGFDGITPALIDGEGKTKLLHIHGVGRHVPGYSTVFLEKLAKELDMPVRNSRYKEIQLTHPRFPDKELGVLRIKRLLNEDETKELLYYELTWSDITAQEKAELEYDTSGEYSYRRAEVNDFLKQFSNDTSPDPMLYLGYRHDEILASFTTAFCWMISADWESLPENSNQFCNPLTEQALANLKTDDYSFVSHSLGSRIAIDGMQDIATKFSNEKERGNLLDEESQLIETFKNKQFTIYMLSNQLPLLQMGRQLPEVTGQTEAYCNASGDQYKKRITDKMEVVAFSDPNDLLSYAIPEDFAEKKLDSRLCIEISNVVINVTDVIDLLGFGKLANPLTAHTAYDSDDRVVALIARGVGNSVTSPLIQEKCKWTRLID